MTTNSQLSTTEPKKNKNKNQTKQTRMETESQKQRSHGWITSAGKWRVENGRKGTGNKKHKWQVQNRQGEVKNNVGNGEAKELICTTHGHELRWRGGNAGGWEVVQGRGGIKGRQKLRQL